MVAKKKTQQIEMKVKTIEDAVQDPNAKAKQFYAAIEALNEIKGK